LNGVYDLMCTAGILWLSKVPFFDGMSQLHPTMFSSKDHSEHPVIKRLLAYWIMTYGTVRLIAGIYTEEGLDYVAAASYFIESLCFEYELLKGKTLVTAKVRFVSIFSAALGLIVIIRPMVGLDI